MASIIAKILNQKAGERIKQVFENLKDGEYELTSPFDAKYNCIAHAAGENDKWWWSVDKKTAGNDVFWFDNVPSQATLENFILAFGKLGYEICDSTQIENGFEKNRRLCQRERPASCAERFSDAYVASAFRRQMDKQIRSGCRYFT